MTTENVKIGFIGYGNMARALAKGWLAAGALKGERIFACAKNCENLKKRAAGDGVTACKDARETALAADIVVVAVKPHIVPEALAPLKELLKEKIVVSVAAGCTFEKYEGWLLPGTHHLSVVPNTPVAVCEGVIVAEERHSLTPEEHALVKELFSKIGLFAETETRLLSVAGTVSGCGPAFAAMFLEALSDAGVQHGLPRALAYRLAAQMLAGTAKLHLATGEHPGKMKDDVCSPGGTTIVGVAALERKGFRSAVIDAVDEIEKKR